MVSKRTDNMRNDKKVVILFRKMEITDNFDKSCLKKVYGIKPNGLC